MQRRLGIICLAGTPQHTPAARPDASLQACRRDAEGVAPRGAKGGGQPTWPDSWMALAAPSTSSNWTCAKPRERPLSRSYAMRT